MMSLPSTFRCHPLLSLRALAPSCVPEIYKLLHACFAMSERNGQTSLTEIWCEQIWFQEDFRNYWDACPWEEDLAICQQVSPLSSVTMHTDSVLT